MRKVTTINLNGRAYQLEEPAYEKLQTYLHHAEAALTKNPDKHEVLSDIEQAIADKCDRILKDGKNVVTAEQMTEILDRMGAVEGETGEASGGPDDGEAASIKRLFVVREGAVFMGVCQGIGAYLGIEPNLVRLGFIILTVFTGGFWIVAYLLLGLFLPTAKNEAELAEAYGKPVTAQAIVAQARERAPDPETWRRLSDILVRLLRIAAKIISVVSAIVFGILTASWLWVVWQLIFGRFDFYGQLQLLNGWREWIGVSAAYLLVGLPLLLVSRTFGRVGDNKPQTRISAVSESLLAVLWGLAVLTLIAFGTAYAQNVRDYANTHHGRIDVGNSHICVDDSRCNQQSPFDYRY